MNIIDRLKLYSLMTFVYAFLIIVDLMLWAIFWPLGLIMALLLLLPLVKQDEFSY